MAIYAQLDGEPHGYGETVVTGQWSPKPPDPRWTEVWWSWEEPGPYGPEHCRVHARFYHDADDSQVSDSSCKHLGHRPHTAAELRAALEVAGVAAVHMPPSMQDITSGRVLTSIYRVGTRCPDGRRIEVESAMHSVQYLLAGGEYAFAHISSGMYRPEIADLLPALREQRGYANVAVGEVVERYQSADGGTPHDVEVRLWQAEAADHPVPA